MTAEISVRSMREEDIPTVAALERASFSEPWSAQGFADALRAGESRFLVAERPDGNIVGYCGMYFAGDEAEITNVAVDQAFRRRGIGTSLLAELMLLAGQQGLHWLFLEVRVSNEAAIRLYQTEGFTPCGTRRDFYRMPTEDALCMCCEIARVRRAGD